ncbi:MAG: hypothetical protein SFY96_09890 [Planctomycetota bacterium]|nr:hypothetical protein [Planctomycetota bacterium]
MVIRVLAISMLLLLRVIGAPGLDAACLPVAASCGSDVALAISDAAAPTCCDAAEACECCVSAPAPGPAHEPTGPVPSELPRLASFFAIDPGVLNVPGDVVLGREVAVPGWRVTEPQRPVARAAAAMTCVWRT